MRVVIVGGGFSGTLLAVHLLRQIRRPVHIEIVDGRAPGRGLAYSTNFDDHILNVAAGRMSAFQDDPAHFLNWLSRNGLPTADGGAFVPRRIYGTYLEDLLQAAVCAAGRNTFCHRPLIATSGRVAGNSIHISCLSGEEISADYLVLACGNPPPHALDGIGFWDLQSPWEPATFRDLPRQSEVLILGTGLTAIDSLLALQSQGHTGRVHMLSRRGKLPHAHFSYVPLSKPATLTGMLGARQLLREIRSQARAAEAANLDWRAVIDSLRPVTNQIWQELNASEQRRVFRHLENWWNIHRHRVAPEVAARVERACVEGQLTIHAGRLQQILHNTTALHAEIMLQSQQPLTLTVQRVINSMGPDWESQQTVNPLLQAMVKQAQLSLNENGRGFRTTRHGECLGADGAVRPNLFAIGPLRFGGLFESTAVPELRVQAEDLAHFLTSQN